MLDNPYYEIKAFMEALYKNIGGRVFEVASLIPLSPLIPDIKQGQYEISTNLHSILIAPPSSGKTSLVKIFEKMCINPYKFKSVTSSKIAQDLKRFQSVPGQKITTTILCDDVAKIMKDKDLIKVLEGVTGEEKTVERLDSRKELKFQIESCSLLGGVWQDLNHYIASGFLFRVIPILITQTESEQDEVLQNISELLKGNGHKQDFEAIQTHYKEIAEAQKSDDAIVGYRISPSMITRATTEFLSYKKHINSQIGNESSSFIVWNREHNRLFSYMVNVAFLNLKNRKTIVEDGQKLLIPDTDDLNIALRLVRREMLIKAQLIRSAKLMPMITSIQDLRSVSESNNFTSLEKAVFQTLYVARKARM